ncbi:hypothetical protein M422DRAFT_27629, partial [Sphaerobolus stellatus SS14]
MFRPFCSAHLMRLELVGGQVISQLYIGITIAMMRAFGADIQREAVKDIYHIKRGVYRNPSEYAIESDASSATYTLAIVAITGTTCTIENVGRSSLQGDARFAKEILEPMGCTVVQTETETTVTGPKEGLRAGGLIDMESMTDAFLTASVLASVATRPAFPERRVEGNETTTRIIGIANQRVKECNRIKAMVDELDRHSAEGVDLEKATGSGSLTTHDPAASVFIIGMGGAGKSHIAHLAGETLDWEIVDCRLCLCAK